MHYQSSHREKATESANQTLRLRVLAVGISIGVLAVIVRLFFLMVVHHEFYAAIASGKQEVYAKLFPKRGTIFLGNARGSDLYPVAMNRDYFLVFADTRAIPDEEAAKRVAAALAEVFGYDEQRKMAIAEEIKKRDDPYLPLEQKADEETVNRVKSRNLPGIHYVRKAVRFYPEAVLAAPIIGFVGKNANGQDIGRYGIEGYWQDALAGSGGFVAGSKSAKGRVLTLPDYMMSPATDGADMVLTIDRTIQYTACEELRSAMAEYGAASASLIMMEPATGAIRVMCSVPDFDPNTYNKVESEFAYNNSTIFTPYEPGSVFKPVTVAAALSAGAITPGTGFLDTGERRGLCKKPIKNAGEKSYGQQNIAGILQNSINTGAVFVAETLGKKKFREAVEAFGFGAKEGIELDTEVGGNIESLSKNSDDRFDCYTATGAFGQGLTVTPLQMASAISVIANGGALMKPYIVDEVRGSDGRVETAKPVTIRRVISAQAAALTRAMMVSVVEKGQAKSARVAGYLVGGKTGTAQIAGPGGYSEETNHTFVGFAPADNPKFVMLIKFEKPQRRYADSTAAPLFAKLAKFILEYYQVPSSR